MANGRNLFIFVDLVHPDDNYDKLSKVVVTLGAVSKISSAFWYVDTACAGADAEAKLRAVCNPADSLLVIDATSNTIHRHNLSPVSEEKLRLGWNALQLVPPPPPPAVTLAAPEPEPEIDRTAPVPAETSSWIARLLGGGSGNAQRPS